MEALKNHKLEFSLVKIANLAWSVINKFLLFVPLAVLIYIFLLLLLNSSRGFDITDESYYVISASQPGNILVSTTQFGYYTGLLYLLSGKNIAVFRIVGVLLLFGAAWFFAFSLDSYSKSTSGYVLKARKRWKEITFLSIGCLAYYKSWLITPSYNWLALLSVLIAGSGLLRATTENHHNRVLSRWPRYILTDGVIVGFGGGLAFMAKPTSALVLAVTALFWIGVHSLRFKLKLFFLVSLCTSCFFLLMHAIVFKDGIVSFYFELRNSLEIERMLIEGYSIGSLFWQAVDDLTQIPAKVFRLTPTGFLLFPVLLGAVWWMKRQGQEAIAKFIHSFFLICFNLFIWYRLWQTGLWSGTSIGLSSIVFSISLLLSALFTLCAWKKSTGESGLIAFKRIVISYVFLFMLAVAPAFGSGNGLVRQMSFGYVFLAAGAIYIAFWIDQYVDRAILGSIVPVLVSISVLIVMMLAFKNPYRLPGNINGQVIESSFLIDSGSLKVDQPTAVYINDLKRIALEAGWEPRTPLIDLTGGSPGATVILDGRIMGIPWLSGGYKGSNEFVTNVLKMVPGSLKNLAWVLTAPEGKRRLSDKILAEIGLNFPDRYVAIGKVRTGHRNELQILWKPLGISQSYLPISQR
jgi:hypothetical protein